MAALTIPQELRGYRRRALESQANNGTHGWDTTPGTWDTDRDAEAYCLDALDNLPAGSTRRVLTGAGSRMFTREAC